MGVKERTRIWGSSDGFGKGVIWDGLGQDIFGVGRGCIAGIPIGMKKRSHLHVLSNCIMSFHINSSQIMYYHTYPFFY